MAGKAQDVYCFADPSNFGVIEFASVKDVRGFLRMLRKASEFEIDNEKSLKFSPNRTLNQRAQDKRLGQIKHQMTLQGHDLEAIKIIWKKNIVKLGDKVVYKFSKGTTEGTGEHIYSNEGIIVKDGVEDVVKSWISQRGGDESD